MTREVTIALDAMGGDCGPGVVLPAAYEVLKTDPALRIVLVGLPEVLESARAAKGERFGERLRLVEASEIVAMDDDPREALRKKKHSSMRVAVELVKSGEAQGCVSAGNTGALMATAKFVLKTLPGVDRPAILAPVPAAIGQTIMLDLGANVGCTAEQLLQFAFMGSVVASDVKGIDRPRVGLLNIGEEDTKGNDVVREAARLLSATALNYVGFVEGDDIFSGRVDVVVSDGFSGNVALKTMEGVAGLISSFVKEEFSRSVSRRVQSALALPALAAVRARLDARKYNGASLVGLNGVVIKSHGGADVVAFRNAIEVGIAEAGKGVPTHISAVLQRQDRSCMRA